VIAGWADVIILADGFDVVVLFGILDLVVIVSPLFSESADIVQECSGQVGIRCPSRNTLYYLNGVQ